MTDDATSVHQTMTSCNAEQAATRCPFLRELATAEGPAFALHIANHPLKPFNAGPVLEEGEDFAATFALFHGPRGVVPLQRTAATVTTASISSFDDSLRRRLSSACSSRTSAPCPATASISLSGFGFLVRDAYSMASSCPGLPRFFHASPLHQRQAGNHESSYSCLCLRYAAWRKGAVRSRQEAAAQPQASDRQVSASSVAAISIAAASA